MSFWSKLFGKEPQSRARGMRCILCGRNVPVNSCEAGHDNLSYAAAFDTWSTESKKVADQLIAKGYGHRVSGRLWIFENPGNNRDGPLDINI